MKFSGCFFFWGIILALHAQAGMDAIPSFMDYPVISGDSSCTSASRCDIEIHALPTYLPVTGAEAISLSMGRDALQSGTLKPASPWCFESSEQSAYCFLHSGDFHRLSLTGIPPLPPLKLEFSSLGSGSFPVPVIILTDCKGMQRDDVEKSFVFFNNQPVIFEEELKQVLYSWLHKAQVVLKQVQDDSFQPPLDLFEKHRKKTWLEVLEDTIAQIEQKKADALRSRLQEHLSTIKPLSRQCQEITHGTTDFDFKDIVIVAGLPEGRHIHFYIPPQLTKPAAKEGECTDMDGGSGTQKSSSKSSGSKEGASQAPQKESKPSMAEERKQNSATAGSPPPSSKSPVESNPTIRKKEQVVLPIFGALPEETFFQSGLTTMTMKLQQTASGSISLTFHDPQRVPADFERQVDFKGLSHELKIRSISPGNRKQLLMALAGMHGILYENFLELIRYRRGVVGEKPYCHLKKQSGEVIKVTLEFMTNKMTMTYSQPESHQEVMYELTHDMGRKSEEAADKKLTLETAAEQHHRKVLEDIDQRYWEGTEESYRQKWQRALKDVPLVKPETGKKKGSILDDFAGPLLPSITRYSSADDADSPGD